MSLRTRRAPPPGGSQAPLAKSSRDARKSKVGDKIKKRMSMRYADISAPQTTPDIPSMPSLTDIRVFEQERYGKASTSVEDFQEEQVREDPRAVDVKFLEQDDFDPDAYLKVKLANSTEAELKSLQSSLEASKAAAATDLQRNVFKNYAEFVVISKEISTLENDMLELKESLSEWKAMPSLLNIDDSNATSDRRRGNRNSIADLRTLYATQLQTLHTTVEGSAKFVPSIPGRHIVMEAENWWALNPATYKVEYAVHFVLLDDLLLVAKRRRKRSGTGGKLVAEKCWTLSEVTIQDVKDAADITHAIKIRRGKETHVYRADRSSDKKNILSTFRTSAEELATRRRKEREGEHERRRSVWTPDDNAPFVLGADADPLPPLPSRIFGQSAGNLAKDKQDKDARWITDFTDELSVAIALQEWDEAVNLIERGEAKLTTTPALEPKLTPLTSSLTSALLHALSDPTQHKAGVVHLTSLLLRLHAGPVARDTFLATRTEFIRKLTRTIRFEGDIGVYIGEFAMVMFTGIKHTADWYLASFREHDMASGLVQWAKEQLEIFAKMFRRQVYSTDVDQRAVQNSLQMTRTQSKRLLQDNGLDFSYLLEGLIAPPSSTPAPSTIPAPRTPQPPVPKLPPTAPLNTTPKVPKSPGPRPPRSNQRQPSISITRKP
ncbi:hypothetical protein BOTBODRAFT_153188 [Botryobasidium botryosum FD-172 SS1]|uniref:Exocyst complex component EXO84 n=1 Tax=Botryobasidium botryosum (strain FD-172 SS1) TaxID=930990 RepID=A0A067N6C5_BOTB1|nr:hypothetical protein BOTBODRAFT_153188 [Botryobasidium botryosum FD-172 SS1]